PAPARTIPTRVGKTIDRVLFVGLGADHPHAGGENRRVRGLVPQSIGPSPRGWGKRAPSVGFLRSRRTIPTRVGKTSWPSRVPDARSDHPHAGGENARRS